MRHREPVPSILIVEDDFGIRTALSRGLAEHGHAVVSAPTAMEGLRGAVDARPDLVVLDLGLPDMDGVDLLRMVRAVSDVPVVVATARDDEQVIVRALDAGADDYVVKPFSADQLAARIRAVLRRTVPGAEPAPALRVGGLVVDVAAREAGLSGEPLDLSPREFDLLAYLAARPGTVISKRELLSEVWQLNHSHGEKTVDVHLSWLRRKLGESAHEPRYLQAVRGVGVKLVDPDR